DASRRRARSRWLVVAHGDVARDRAAPCRRMVAREDRSPRPRSRHCDLGEPGIRRPAVPLTRCGRDAAIGRDQRKLGFSATKTTRKAAPFHGAIGEDKAASSAASWQTPDAPWAWASATEKRKPKSAPAISDDAVTAAANWRIRDN